MGGPGLRRGALPRLPRSARAAVQLRVFRLRRRTFARPTRQPIFSKVREIGYIKKNICIVTSFIQFTFKTKKKFAHT